MAKGGDMVAENAHAVLPVCICRRKLLRSKIRFISGVNSIIFGTHTLSPEKLYPEAGVESK